MPAVNALWNVFGSTKTSGEGHAHNTFISQPGVKHRVFTFVRKYRPQVRDSMTHTQAYHPLCFYERGAKVVLMAAVKFVTHWAKIHVIVSDAWK